MTNVCIARFSAATALIAAAAGVAAAAKYVPAGVAPARVTDAANAAANLSLTRSAVKLYGTGGAYNNVNITAPVVLDKFDGFFNNAVVESIGGGAVGATTTFDDVFFGAADGRPAGWTNDDEKATPIPPTNVPNHYSIELANFVARITPNSNNVSIDESIESPIGFVPEGGVPPNGLYSTGHRDWSNGLGSMLTDGTTIFRANFNSARGISQNNIESQNLTTSPTAAAGGTKYFNANTQIDGVTPGSSFLAPPSGVRLNAGGLLLGQLIFSSGTTNSPKFGVGVWQYGAAVVKQDWTNPSFRWPVKQYPLIADQNGHTPNTAPAENATAFEVRTSNIRMMKLANAGCSTETSYVTFGEGSTTAAATNPVQNQHLFTGSGFAPRVFFVDSIAGSAATPTFNGFTDGFAFIAADPAAVYTPGSPGTIGPINSNYRFIEIQGTGSNGFAQHGINAKGQVVALWADFTDTLNPVYQVRRYDPIFDVANPCKIVGYSPAVVIAQNTTTTTPVSYNGTSFVLANSAFVSGTCPAQTLGTSLGQPFSGVAIDDSGNVSFVGTVSSDEVTVNFVDCNNLPLGTAPVSRSTTTTLCFHDASTNSLYRVADGGQLGDTLLSTNGGPQYRVGVMPTDGGSDGYGAEGMSSTGNFMALTCRNGRDESNTDSNADGFQQDGGTLNPGLASETSARATLIVSMGAITPACPCTADINGDCSVNTADLTALLGNFGKSCPAQLPCPIPGDLDHNNTVNTSDLTALLGQFGCHQ